MDCRRLARNLLFFFLGLLVPLLSFQSAFAVEFDYASLSVGDVFPAADGQCWISATRKTYSNVTVSSCPDVTWANQTLSIYTCPSAVFAANNPGYVGFSGKADIVTHQAYYTTDCPPSEPATWSNGELDPDEDGIDCGGDTGEPCVKSCPSGMDVRLHSSGVEICVYVSVPNVLGQCPAGKVPSDPPGECHDNNSEWITESSQDWLDLNIPTTEQVPSPDFKGSLSTVSSEDAEAEAVTDNGDGTETAVLEKSFVNPDGSTGTSTATVERPAGSPTGTGFTDSPGSGGGGVGIAPGFEGGVTGTGETNGNEDPENFNFDGDVQDGVFDGSLDGDLIPEKVSIGDLIMSGIEQLPVVQALQSMGVTSSNTQCSVYIGEVYGEDLSFDFCQWEGHLRIFGGLLVGFAQLSAPLIVFFGLGGRT